MKSIKLKNITYHLVKLEEALVFQILEQDNSWKGWDDWDLSNPKSVKSFETKNGHLIHSWSGIVEIEIEGEKIFIELLSFDTGKDEDKFSINFESNTQRDEYYNKINEALEEWDNHVEQSKEKDDK